jgi:hypothetical protein
MTPKARLSARHDRRNRIRPSDGWRPRPKRELGLQTDFRLRRSRENCGSKLNIETCAQRGIICGLRKSVPPYKGSYINPPYPLAGFDPPEEDCERFEGIEPSSSARFAGR